MQSSGAPATGRATIRIRLYRKSDNQFLDWSDATFKAAGHIAIEAVMSEIDATNAPGHYELAGGFNVMLRVLPTWNVADRMREQMEIAMQSN